MSKLDEAKMVSLKDKIMDKEAEQEAKEELQEKRKETKKARIKEEKKVGGTKKIKKNK